MFKRIERKRKRREREEELGLDQDTKEAMGLRDTDSDGSDSDSEQELGGAQSDEGSDTEINGDGEGDAVFGDEGVDEVPPITVAEALREPIYFISSDPVVHGCVLCKGKLIRNDQFVTAHKNSKAHKRRLDRFVRLAVDADSNSSAWELVRVIRSAYNLQNAESQEPSKRALKRQLKQAAVREKRKRSKELKMKAMAKKASKKLQVLVVDETRPVNSADANPESSSGLQKKPVKARKKQRLEDNAPTSTVTTARSVTKKLISRTRASDIRPQSRGNEKSIPKPERKRTEKASKLQN